MQKGVPVSRQPKPVSPTGVSGRKKNPQRAESTGQAGVPPSQKLCPKSEDTHLDAFHLPSNQVSWRVLISWWQVDPFSIFPQSRVQVRSTRETPAPLQGSKERRKRDSSSAEVGSEPPRSPKFGDSAPTLTAGSVGQSILSGPSRVHRLGDLPLAHPLMHPYLAPGLWLQGRSGSPKVAVGSAGAPASGRVPTGSGRASLPGRAAAASRALDCEGPGRGGPPANPASMGGVPG